MKLDDTKQKSKFYDASKPENKRENDNTQINKT